MFLWFGLTKWFGDAQRETLCFWVISTSTWSESRIAFPVSLCNLPSCRLPFKTSLTCSPWAHKLHDHQNKGKDPEQQESPMKLLGHEAVGNGCYFVQGCWLEPNFDVQAAPFTSTPCLQCFARSHMYPLLLCSLNYNNTVTSSWVLPHENPATAEWSQWMDLPWVLQWVLDQLQSVLVALLE